MSEGQTFDAAKPGPHGDECDPTPPAPHLDCVETLFCDAPPEATAVERDPRTAARIPAQAFRRSYHLSFDQKISQLMISRHGETVVVLSGPMAGHIYDDALTQADEDAAADYLEGAVKMALAGALASTGTGELVVTGSMARAGRMFREATP